MIINEIKKQGGENFKIIQEEISMQRYNLSIENRDELTKIQSVIDHADESIALKLTKDVTAQIPGFNTVEKAVKTGFKKFYTSCNNILSKSKNNSQINKKQYVQNHKASHDIESKQENSENHYLVDPVDINLVKPVEIIGD